MTWKDETVATNKEAAMRRLKSKLRERLGVKDKQDIRLSLKGELVKLETIME